MRRYRQERREAVRQLVGNHWSEEGTPEKVPVNLLSLYVSIVGRNLIAKNPRVMLSTFERSMKPTVSAMESWCNKEVEAMHLANTLQRVVVDALFSIGIAKVALATPADAAHLAWNLRAGQPFAERVDLDDFVYDVHARDFDECSFLGHRYRAPLEVVRESKLYSRDRKDLTASADNPYNLEGDERIGMLGRGYYATNTEEFEDQVDLWEVYLPRHRLVLTLADDQLAAGPREALRTQGWVGPDEGPYHILGYGTVPGNAMPKGPIQDLVDLHEAANRGFRKVFRTLDRIKEVTGVRGGALENGERVMRADDGELIRLDDPSAVNQIVFGGQHIQVVFAISNYLKEMFSWAAGNLDMMGGLSPQSKTLGQDRLLAENAARSIADLQDRTLTHAISVIKGLCWYWWHDPFRVMKTTHKIPGLADIELSRPVTPDMRRRGRFEDLDIAVDPYSMRHQTPETRMAGLNQVVQQIVIPMMQLLVQQGVAFDINAYLQKISKYMDMPDLAEIMTIQEPPQQDTYPGVGDAGPKPAQTERTYTRENVPMRTSRGDSQNMNNALMGIDTGGAQKNGQMPNLMTR